MRIVVPASQRGLNPVLLTRRYVRPKPMSITPPDNIADAFLRQIDRRERLEVVVFEQLRASCGIGQGIRDRRVRSAAVPEIVVRASGDIGEIGVTESMR